jgi:hypothetical protein
LVFSQRRSQKAYNDLASALTALTLALNHLGYLVR